MKKSFEHLSKFRVREGVLKSTDAFERCGAFDIPFKNNLILIQVIATDGQSEEYQTNWEHVSAKARIKGAPIWRTPTWEEMCFIKDLFWDSNETVIQYHPAESNYINVHPAVLHLWKPTKEIIPMPPLECV
jgi:hypothetical protein